MGSIVKKWSDGEDVTINFTGNSNGTITLDFKENFTPYERTLELVIKTTNNSIVINKIIKQKGITNYNFEFYVTGDGIALGGPFYANTGMLWFQWIWSDLCPKDPYGNKIFAIEENGSIKNIINNRFVYNSYKGRIANATDVLSDMKYYNYQ